MTPFNGMNHILPIDIYIDVDRQTGSVAVRFQAQYYIDMQAVYIGHITVILLMVGSSFPKVLLSPYGCKVNEACCELFAGFLFIYLFWHLLLGLSGVHVLYVRIDT